MAFVTTGVLFLLPQLFYCKYSVWFYSILNCINKFLSQSQSTCIITNFPFLSSNIPSSPAYGVFISQLIRYARACSSYECFILRARRLSSKLLKQWYLVERVKSSFRFYGRYGDLVEQYGVTLSRMLNDILTLDQQWLPYRSDFPPISWPLYRAWTFTELWVVSMEHLQRVWLASRETLTLPDTWFRPPFWDLLMLQLLRPNSSNLPCLYSTFHLEYPLVLSRFCFEDYS